MNQRLRADGAGHDMRLAPSTPPRRPWRKAARMYRHTGRLPATDVPKKPAEKETISQLAAAEAD